MTTTPDTPGSPLSETASLLGETPQNDVLPPDAAARDAAKRQDAEHDDALTGDDMVFVTRNVSDEERAAVIAVLTAARAEETRRVKRVSRRNREPWARSQRVPDRISDLLVDG